ncbi:MAG: DUF4954 family protein [Rikenellaceae bacterium]
MYRNLSESEISALESRGCFADDWSKVEIVEFDATRLRNVQFRGCVKVGVLSKMVELADSIEVPSSLSDVVLYNCTVGDNVYINGVRQYISNYTIENDVIISGVDLIAATAGATFGNGVTVSVLNEAGGREVSIFNELSSQIAYIYALYRDNAALIAALDKMVASYSEEVARGGAYIGKNVTITNCGEIRNVNIGAGATIDGVAKLIDGSINSTLEAPSYLGRDVIAQHFIVLSAARITDGVLLDKCFVGQGCELGKQFSAENSLFFSNCIGMHGESCATFAGPYTVSHHKSTLLIGGMFSFMNAGSGSNQSNHMYKFGPVHQGVVERGSKLASDSYILWPMRVGAFSLIIGKHYSNADTTMLPFSYIIEKDYGQPTIVPAANLRSVGTIRDATKWPKRDKRGCSKQLDVINFKLLNPYTVSRMIKGRNLLLSMVAMGGPSTIEYVYGGCKMKRNYVERGIKFYDAAIFKFLGGALINRLNSAQWTNLEELKAILKTDSTTGQGPWIDVSAALCPASEVEKVVNAIVSGELSKPSQIINRFNEIDQKFDSYVWNWSIGLVEEQLGCTAENIDIQKVIDFMHTYINYVKDTDMGIYTDAKKEFGGRVRTSFGIDGASDVQDADFEAVRGEFEKSDFVGEVLRHLEHKTEQVAQITKQLQSIL